MPDKINDEDARVVLSRARNRDFRYKAQKLFRSASDSRKRYDWEWLTRDLFRRGFQFSRYNPASKTVVLATRSNIKIPINIVHAQMRTIKNQVTSVRPKWEVMPIGLSDDAVTNARYSGKLLDYYYDKLQLRRKIKETVIQGLMYSVGGPWQVGYDEDGGEDGQGEVFIWLLDPFDFYIDPNATSLNDAEYVVKAVRKPLAEIKSNLEYDFHINVDDLHGEMKQAASEYKQFLLQALKNYQAGDSEEEEEGAILYEAWIKTRVTEKNQEEIQDDLKANDQDAKDLRIGEVLMRRVTYLDMIEDPLEVVLFRRSDFPFCLYQADVNPMEVYGESWIKHVIPMNRALNALESSTFRYNYKYAIGRIVVDKNSGVRIISNEHGDIIEKNAGAEVSALPLQPLPQSYENQIDNMRRYLEDVGGAHEVSMGRIPTGVKSGIGIAELKAADAVNQQDLLDGMEEFLTEVAQKILKEISMNYDVPKIVKVLGKGGDPEHFAVVGSKSGSKRNKNEVKIGTDIFKVATIGSENEIKVNIGSWLSHTKEERLNQLKEYFEAGLIDKQTFLENAEFPDVKNIIRRTRQEELLAKMSGQPSQAANGAPVSDEEIAEQENYMMQVEGRTNVEPQPEDNHQVHLIIHQEALGVNGNPAIEEHMAKHERMIEMGITGNAVGNAGPLPQQPMGPEPMMGPPPPPPAPPMGAAIGPGPGVPPGDIEALLAGMGGAPAGPGLPMQEMV